MARLRATSPSLATKIHPRHRGGNPRVSVTVALLPAPREAQGGTDDNADSGYVSSSACNRIVLAVTHAVVPRTGVDTHE